MRKKAAVSHCPENATLLVIDLTDSSAIEKQHKHMKRTITHTMLPLATGLLLCLPAIAQEEAKSDPTKPQTPLQAGELTAAKDNFTIPNPGELLLAAKDKIDLKAIVAKIGDAPVVDTKGSDAVLAHSLGELLADGFICLHAQDAAKTKAIGKQLLAIGKELGADELILAEGKKIGEMVDAGNWSDASTAADAFRTRLLTNLAKDGDMDLITIISASGWLHGFGLIADQINASYNEEASRQLRQGDLATHLAGRVAKLPEGRVTDAAKAAAALTEIAKLTTVAQDASISKEAIAKIAASSKEGMTSLTGVQEKK